MKIQILLTEYENDPDGTVVNLNTSLPDGSSHQEVTDVFYRALSALYGYQIGNQDANPFSNS